jgi:metal-responsive CopG/Arc/MetJ family transcriptional regulator
MSARPVQISIDTKLLERVDRDPQTKREGRSAFIRSAIELYLAARRKRAIDASIADAYRDADRELLADAEPWLEEQAWPEE